MSAVGLHPLLLDASASSSQAAAARLLTSDDETPVLRLKKAISLASLTPHRA